MIRVFHVIQQDDFDLEDEINLLCESIHKNGYTLVDIKYSSFRESESSDNYSALIIYKTA